MLCGVSHLQEHGRVFLINRHQLNVCNSINETHSQTWHWHSNCQQQHIIAKWNDGKNHRDDEGGEEEGGEGTQQPEEEKKSLCEKYFDFIRYFSFQRKKLFESFDF